MSLALATPGTVSSRRLILRSASVVSSRGASAVDRTARDTTGTALKSSFWMTGSLMPGGQFAPDGTDLGLRLLRDVVDLHLEVELDHDGRHALARHRRDVLHAGDGIHRFFDAPAHFALDGLRRGARELGEDRQHRNLDLGHQVDRQAADGEQAQRDERQHHHGGDDRPPDRKVGEEHRYAPPSFATTTRSPWLSAKPPRTTTESPAESPAVISTTPPPVAPTFTPFFST